MIPIKEAITIFEQYKINQIRDNNPIIFKTSFDEFSAHKYIIDKVIEWLPLNKDYAISIPIIKPNKSLLSFLKKKYHRLNKEPLFGEGLALYGKKVIYTDFRPRATHDYEEIYYWNYHEDKESEIEFDFSTDASKVKNYIDLNEEISVVKESIFTDLFENYDYQEIYNLSTNYTVMGDKVTNTICYMDISVDIKEFKTFLDSELINPQLSKHVEIINKMLEKYVNKVDEVFRSTIEKKKQLDSNYIPTEYDLSKDLPKIHREDVKTLDKFIEKYIKRQIKYNEGL